MAEKLRKKVRETEDLNLYYIKSKDAVVAKLPKNQVDVEYPGDWFASNKDMKPIVLVPKCSEKEALDATHHMLTKSMNYNLDVTIAFLWHLCNRMQTILEEEWTSFERQLYEVVDDKMITGPRCLLSARETGALTSPTLESPNTTKTWIAYGLGTLWAYRAESLRYTTHREIVTDKINRTLSACSIDGISASIVQNNINYKRLAAAIDMYLRKVGNMEPEYSLLRQVTITACWRDSASFQALSHLNTISAMPMKNLMLFSAFESAASKAFRILKTGNSLGEPDSYVPYALWSFELVSKSALSAVANPNITLGSTWSAKAIRPANAQTLNCVNNAALIYHVIGKSMQLGYILGDSTAPQEVRDEAEKIASTTGVTRSEGEPTGNEPHDWFVYLHDHYQGMIPQKWRHDLYQAWSGIVADRDNTVGKFVVEWARSKGFGTKSKSSKKTTKVTLSDDEDDSRGSEDSSPENVPPKKYSRKDYRQIALSEPLYQIDDKVEESSGTAELDSEIPHASETEFFLRGYTSQ